MNATQLCDALHHINRVKSMNLKLNGSSYELAMEYIQKIKIEKELTLDDFLKRKLGINGIKNK